MPEVLSLTSLRARSDPSLPTWLSTWAASNSAGLGTASYPPRTSGFGENDRGLRGSVPVLDGSGLSDEIADIKEGRDPGRSLWLGAIPDRGGLGAPRRSVNLPVASSNWGDPTTRPPSLSLSSHSWPGFRWAEAILRLNAAWLSFA